AATPQAGAADEHHYRQRGERGPRDRPSGYADCSANRSVARLAAAREPSWPPPRRARRGGGRLGLFPQGRADAPAERVERRETQRGVTKRRAQHRERGALARAIGALLEMALDFERRFESQLAV